MSYRNPKYTYISSQPAFDKLTDSVVGAAQTISSKIEKSAEEDKKKGEALAQAAQGVSSAYVRDYVGKNNVGNQNTQGAVTNFFKGKAKLVGDLVKATKGANRSCEIDGDCEEKEAELARLQNAPTEIKTMMETVLDQLDYESIDNFDASQNPDLILASNIMSGKPLFGSEQGYTYSLEEGEGGSYDLVFKGEEFEGGSYTINSAELQAITGPGGTPLLQNTQKASTQQSEVMKNTEIIQGANFDPTSGAYMGSGGFFNAASFAGVASDGVNMGYGTNTDSKGVVTYYAIIDEKKVNETIKPGVAQALESNFGIGEENSRINDGQVRTYWNKVISSKDWAKNALNSYDEDELRNVFGDQKSTVEQLKTRWGDVLTTWTTRKDLSDDQIAVFKELYLKQQAQNITQAMQSHPSNTVSKLDISNFGINNDKAQDEAIDNLES